VFGASITLIPGLPLIKVLILVQTLNGVLLPVLLVFITRLASSRKLMNDYRSKGLTLIINWVTTVSLGLLAAWLVISTMLLPLVGIHLGK
ncbi:MAG: divalent metal cation transporter, partial [Armatimonadota bacterium]